MVGRIPLLAGDREGPEKFHAGRMVADAGAERIYLDQPNREVAKIFALREKAGWVYVVLVEGGIVIPERARSLGTRTSANRRSPIRSRYRGRRFTGFAK